MMQPITKYCSTSFFPYIPLRPSLISSSASANSCTFWCMTQAKTRLLFCWDVLCIGCPSGPIIPYSLLWLQGEGKKKPVKEGSLTSCSQFLVSANLNAHTSSQWTDHEAGLGCSGPLSILWIEASRGLYAILWRGSKQCWPDMHCLRFLLMPAMLPVGLALLQTPLNLLPHLLDRAGQFWRGLWCVHLWGIWSS